MPLHDQPRTASLPRLGKIRLGYLTQNAKGVEYPTNADHFVLTDHAERLKTYYGDQPRELLIYLPFAFPDENFNAYYVQWSGAEYQLCAGDGDTIKNRVDPGDRTVVLISDYRVLTPYHEADGQAYEVGEAVPCSGKRQHLYPRCQHCSPTAWLKVMVRNPHRPRQVVYDELGYYELTTQSVVNYRTLIGRLDYIYKLAQQFDNDLRGIPMILKRVKETMYYNTVGENGEGQKRRVTQWMLDLQIDPAWIRAAMSGANRLALNIAGHLEAGQGAPVLIDRETGEIMNDTAEDQPPPTTGRPYPAETVRAKLLIEKDSKRQAARRTS